MTIGSTVPLHQPASIYPAAFITHGFAQPNGNFAFTQPGYPTDLQYPGNLNAWNDYTGPAENQAGDPYFGVTFSNPSMGLVGVSQDFGLQYPQTNPFGFTPEAIHGYYPATLPGVPEMPSMNDAQLVLPPNPATAPPAALLAAVPTAINDTIRCPKGCRATFSRGEELRRHMKKHQVHRFRCPLIECDKTFYRGDKLRDHLKKGHKGTNPLDVK